MAVKTYSVVEITCDLCGSECAGDDGNIHIQVNSGDGRDVGSAYISGRISFTQPYQCVSGDICQACKIEWLRRYVEAQQPRQSEGGDKT